MPDQQGFDPTGITAGISGVVGLAQTLIESGKAKKANKELGRLFKQRKSFQTPDEVFQILQMNENNAQAGFGAETLDYLTSGANVGLSSSLSTAKMLGADPNALGATVDSYFRDIFKIGGENELMKLKKFDGLQNALTMVAQNKEAEQISKDNLIKDQMQAQAQKVGAAQQGVQSGLNLGLNALSTFATKNMYGNKNGTNSSTTNTVTNTVGSPASEVLTPAELLRRKQLQDAGIGD
jgi:hypothetical protein